jgi:hypothetical protein
LQIKERESTLDLQVAELQVTIEAKNDLLLTLQVTTLQNYFIPFNNTHEKVEQKENESLKSTIEEQTIQMKKLIATRTLSEKLITDFESSVKGVSIELQTTGQTTGRINKSGKLHHMIFANEAFMPSVSNNSLLR